MRERVYRGRDGRRPWLRERGWGQISRPELNGKVVLELQRGNWMGVCRAGMRARFVSGRSVCVCVCGVSLRLKDPTRDRKWAELGLSKEMLNPPE